ncbi:MAG: NAD-dependent epimerase/dehydratase family protein [Myxococcales bacterium]|nr:NAD-dependent epimerase/dehydratase family protein [Myxococcales bacterium]
MAGQTALVTGGAGLVGSHICDQLIEAGIAHIRVFDDFSRGRIENLEVALATGKVEIVRGDLRDVATVGGAVAGCDLVFHQAAIRITRCAQEPRLALEVLVDGTFNVVEACVRHGVKKLVAASSASVYGPADTFPTDESHVLYNNRTLYGACKVANEQMYRAFAEMNDLNYVALRYFNIYGPRMDVFGVYTEVLVRWLDRLDAGEAPVLFGDGSQTMDFVYIGDVARSNLLAARAPVSDAVYNVASGAETSLVGLCDALLRAAGRTDVHPTFKPMPAERRGVEVVRRLASTVAAQAELGFEAQVGLEEGLRHFIAWRAAEKANAAQKTKVTA